jgi:hypothetical protein
VRDCSRNVFPVRTKSPEPRYRVPPESDDSKSERQLFPVGPETVPVLNRVSRGIDSHGLSHPIRWQALRRDNRNPVRKDRSGAVAGICNLRSFSFEADATKFVRNPWHVCAGDRRESFGRFFTHPVSCKKEKIRLPLTSILSPQAGRGGSVSGSAQV